VLSEDLKENWERVVGYLGQEFGGGEKPDLDAVLFLIGVQELGSAKRKFKKDEKVNLMHIAICRVLEPYGYYEYEGLDEDGWPHYRLKEKLPNLKAGEQSILMKEAVVRYFRDNEIL
tara:strand:- start:131 stop:481 length:351 start_codon:yes stop_codon:yes gene_type:complete